MKAGAGSNEISIRPYEANDLDAVIEIFIRAIRETASADYTPSQVSAWAQVDKDAWSKRRSSRPTWIAEFAGIAAGFTDLESDGHLDMMYVHPMFGGRGVARTLLQKAQQHAETSGLTRIFCEVSLTARPLFERSGFHVVEPERAFRNGQWFDRFRMEKRLGKS